MIFFVMFKVKCLLLKVGSLLMLNNSIMSKISSGMFIDHQLIYFYYRIRK